MNCTKYASKIVQFKLLFVPLTVYRNIHSKLNRIFEYDQKYILLLDFGADFSEAVCMCVPGLVSFQPLCESVSSQT